MRLFVVANRLPVTLSVHKNGTTSLKESVGGLTSGVNAYLTTLAQRRTYTSITWVGSLEHSTIHTPALLRTLAKKNLITVPSTKKAFDAFYNGFCNSTLWPLFHGLTSRVTCHESDFHAYERTNAAFAATLLPRLKKGDTVWIHDYHLLLLPALLRKKRPDLTIGFFLHIPFPQFEVFRILPAPIRESLAKGLLGADLIGVHTSSDAEYLTRCLIRFGSAEQHTGGVISATRTTHIEAFPLGIEPHDFTTFKTLPSVTSETRTLTRKLGTKKLILSIDRLDYTKGIDRRLAAFERFLEQHPDRRLDTVLVLIVVPSRTGVPDYQRMKQEIDEFVGRINGRFSSFDHQPIIYQYRALPRALLTAWYQIASVMLVTPLRDGMNLIAKEFVASQPEHRGMLILSEMAGAAYELPEALIVNPYDTQSIADAIHQALTMPEEERSLRTARMQDRLRRYTTTVWGDDFFTSLAETTTLQTTTSTPLTKKVTTLLTRQFRAATQRTLLLDYDGTLTPLIKIARLAAPTPALKHTLLRLAQLKNTTLYIISGRKKDILEQWLGDLPITLIAEHGAFVKRPGEPFHLRFPATTDFKDYFRPLLARFADKTPGSFIEEKELALVWHYRGAQKDIGQAAARELTDSLRHLASSVHADILPGNKIVEIRPQGLAKHLVLSYFPSILKSDFLLAAGDDTTDEDLLRALPPSAHRIKVGTTSPSASITAESPADILALLAAFKQKK